MEDILLTVALGVFLLGVVVVNSLSDATIEKIGKKFL